ncbi:MAG: YihY/virulence factor BrkB family protein [Pikeienuella sp.]
MNRLKAFWRVAVRSYTGFSENDGTALAGYVAFASFLSLFPFAIFATAMVGVLTGPEDAQSLIDALFELAPAHIAQTIQPVIKEVTATQGGGLLTFSAVGALWAASNAAEATRVGFDRAFGFEEKRGFVLGRLRAIGFVLLAGLTFALLGFLIILAPLGFDLIESYTGYQVPLIADVARYALGLGGFALFLMGLMRGLPSRPPKFRALWPGVAVTTVLWITGATAFSIYLSFAPSYTLTYGAFAGVIVVLLFFYLTGAAIIFGAEVNAALLVGKKDTTDGDDT